MMTTYYGVLVALTLFCCSEAVPIEYDSAYNNNYTFQANGYIQPQQSNQFPYHFNYPSLSYNQPTNFPSRQQYYEQAYGQRYYEELMRMTSLPKYPPIIHIVHHHYYYLPPNLPLQQFSDGSSYDHPTSMIGFQTNPYNPFLPKIYEHSENPQTAKLPNTKDFNFGNQNTQNSAGFTFNKQSPSSYQPTQLFRPPHQTFIDEPLRINPYNPFLSKSPNDNLENPQVPMLPNFADSYFGNQNIQNSAGFNFNKQSPSTFQFNEIYTPPHQTVIDEPWRVNPYNPFLPKSQNENSENPQTPTIEKPNSSNGQVNVQSSKPLPIPEKTNGIMKTLLQATTSSDPVFLNSTERLLISEKTNRTTTFTEPSLFTTERVPKKNVQSLEHLSHKDVLMKFIDDELDDSGSGSGSGDPLYDFRKKFTEPSLVTPEPVPKKNAQSLEHLSHKDVLMKFNDDELDDSGSGSGSGDPLYDFRLNNGHHMTKRSEQIKKSKNMEDFTFADSNYF